MRCAVAICRNITKIAPFVVIKRVKVVRIVSVRFLICLSKGFHPLLHPPFIFLAWIGAWIHRNKFQHINIVMNFVLSTHEGWVEVPGIEPQNPHSILGGFQPVGHPFLKRGLPFRFFRSRRHLFVDSFNFGRVTNVWPFFKKNSRKEQNNRTVFAVDNAVGYA